MADLTRGEQFLFGKYWGKDNLIDNEDFWTSALASLVSEDKVIVLPLEHNSMSVRRILEMLQCPPGKCGICCRYKRIPVNELDLQRLEEYYPDKQPRQKVKTADDIGTYLDGSNGCPFLENNTCAVHDHRPDVCYHFPIQGGIEGNIGGRSLVLMRLRLKCPAALNIARKILAESIRNGGGKTFLLPDLSIVPKIETPSKSVEV